MGFDLDQFLADCRLAAEDGDPRGAVHDLLKRTMASSSAIAGALGADKGGLEVLHSSEDLTVLNVTWAPRMTLPPHEHRMWAAIGIYGGAEENRLYRRGPERIVEAGERVLDTGDVFGLGREAIHAVHNPRAAFTGAIHVYGGDFVNAPRSQWDPDTLLEEPFTMEDARRRFAEANEQWRLELGQDLDESSLT